MTAAWDFVVDVNEAGVNKAVQNAWQQEGTQAALAPIIAPIKDSVKITDTLVLEYSFTPNFPKLPDHPETTVPVYIKLTAKTEDRLLARVTLAVRADFELRFKYLGDLSPVVETSECLRTIITAIVSADGECAPTTGPGGQSIGINLQALSELSVTLLDTTLPPDAIDKIKTFVRVIGKQVFDTIKIFPLTPIYTALRQDPMSDLAIAFRFVSLRNGAIVTPVPDGEEFRPDLDTIVVIGVRFAAPNLPQQPMAPLSDMPLRVNERLGTHVTLEISQRTLTFFERWVAPVVARKAIEARFGADHVDKDYGLARYAQGPGGWVLVNNNDADTLVIQGIHDLRIAEFEVLTSQVDYLVVEKGPFGIDFLRPDRYFISMISYNFKADDTDATKLQIYKPAVVWTKDNGNVWYDIVGVAYSILDFAEAIVSLVVGDLDEAGKHFIDFGLDYVPFVLAVMPWIMLFVPVESQGLGALPELKYEKYLNIQVRFIGEGHCVPDDTFTMYMSLP